MYISTDVGALSSRRALVRYIVCPSGEKEIIPCGSTLLLAGDLVTVMTNEQTAPNVLDDISKKETLEAIIKLNKLLDDENIESYFKSDNENIVTAEIDSKYFTEDKITGSKEINESGYNYKGYTIIDNPQENLWYIKGQNRNFNTDKDAEDFIDGLEELEEGLKHKNSNKIKN